MHSNICCYCASQMTSIMFMLQFLFVVQRINSGEDYHDRNAFVIRTFISPSCLSQLSLPAVSPSCLSLWLCVHSIRNYPCYCDQESRTEFSCNQYHLSSLERKALGCNIQNEFILLFFSYKLEQDIRGAIFSFAAYSCKRDIGSVAVILKYGKLSMGIPCALARAFKKVNGITTTMW